LKTIHLSIIGFGVVGQGLAELVASKQELLRQQFDLDVRVVSVANRRHGFIYREGGLDIPLLLELVTRGRPLTEHPGITRWAQPLDGLLATGADILAEATGTNLRDAEPGMSHIRGALTHGIHVITANKGPIALAAHELLALARQRNLQLRLESTVMAGTPVISTLREGVAGASIRSIHGILNGTTNYILSAMTSGRAYADVLAEAQAQGYAEADPTADVEGYDAVAKVLILAALIFGQVLKPDQVVRQGITHITRDRMLQALEEGKRIKLIGSLFFNEDNQFQARVEPMALPEHEVLARIDGVMNALTFQADTLSQVTIVGPGAGRLQTGQGLLTDLIAVSRMMA
jgi:homoserine dehydrogenase